jgi:hypothetical protein
LRRRGDASERVACDAVGRPTNGSNVIRLGGMRDGEVVGKSYALRSYELETGFETRLVVVTKTYKCSKRMQGDKKRTHGQQQP